MIKYTRADFRAISEATIKLGQERADRSAKELADKKENLRRLQAQLAAFKGEAE